VTAPWAPPSVVGDKSDDVTAAKAVLRRFEYGKGLTPGPVYTTDFGSALRTFQGNRNAEIDRGSKPGPKMAKPGTLNWSTKKQLGILADQLPPAPPPPAKRRHAALVFRGTGGVVDQDYVYELARQADLEIIYLDFPASMGGLPPGAAGQPSAQTAVRIGYQSAVTWIRNNPSRTFQLYGYSLGEIVVAQILESLFTSGSELAPYQANYVASVHIGPPARPVGGAFYGGTAAPGVGIASNRLSDRVYKLVGNRACYLCHPDDMYGSIPVPKEGGTGDIMETVYDLITGIELGRFIDTIGAMMPHLLEIAQDAGVFGMLGLLAPVLGGNPVPLLGALLPVLSASLPALIGPGGGNPTGPAAAAQAAVLGMKFLLAGTRPHIEYHIREVWPGQTYFGLGVQHARDWASRVAVR